MTESTFSEDFEAIRIEVADYLGLSRTSTDWSTDDTNRLASYMKLGLSQFYRPPKIMPDKEPHKWSFLTPVAEMSIAEDDTEVTLPDDFASMACRYLTFDSNITGPRIKLIGEGQLRTMEQGNTNSGQPRFAAVEPIVSSGASGQRWRLSIYPQADQDYTVYYRYRVLGDALVTTEYAYGGAAHTQTIIQSCIAAAELRMNSAKGPQWEHFVTLLTASIEHDAELSRTHDFGYNGDDVQDSHQRHYADSYTVLINGTDPDDF